MSEPLLSDIGLLKIMWTLSVTMQWNAAPESVWPSTEEQSRFALIGRTTIPTEGIAEPVCRLQKIQWATWRPQYVEAAGSTNVCNLAEEASSPSLQSADTHGNYAFVVGFRNGHFISVFGHVHLFEALALSQLGLSDHVVALAQAVDFRSLC